MTASSATTKPRQIQKTVALTGSSNQPKTESEPWEVSKSWELRVAKVVGSWEIMEAKMMVEIPLPIPCSVMSSPSHIKIVEPATIAETETIQSIVVGSATMEVFEARTD